MTKRRPLRLRTCESCQRNYYSRSNKSQYCCVAHQVKEWRAKNKLAPVSQDQLEQEYINQEKKNTSNKEVA